MAPMPSSGHPIHDLDGELDVLQELDDRLFAGIEASDLAEPDLAMWEEMELARSRGFSDSNAEEPLLQAIFSSDETLDSVHDLPFGVMDIIIPEPEELDSLHDGGMITDSSSSPDYSSSQDYSDNASSGSLTDGESPAPLGKPPTMPRKHPSQHAFAVHQPCSTPTLEREQDHRQAMMVAQAKRKVGQITGATGTLRRSASETSIKTDTEDDSMSVCTSGSSEPCSPMLKRARVTVLTQDERAKKSRDRNREHARNTRLRKKAYLEELQKTVRELTQDKEHQELHRQSLVQQQADRDAARFQVLLSFMDLRSRCVTDARRWGGLLEDSFVLQSPATPYLPRADAGQDGVLEAQGAQGVASEMESLSIVLAPLVSADGVLIRHTVARGDCVFGGDVVMGTFSMVVSKPDAAGRPCQFVSQGMLNCLFGPQNRLARLVLQFNAAPITSHLQACGLDMGPLPMPIVRSVADSGLDSGVLQSVIENIRCRQVSSTAFKSTDQLGEAYWDHLRVFPIIPNEAKSELSGTTTHFLGLLERVKAEADGSSPPATAMQDIKLPLPPPALMALQQQRLQAQSPKTRGVTSPRGRPGTPKRISC